MAGTVAVLGAGTAAGVGGSASTGPIRPMLSPPPGQTAVKGPPAGGGDTVTFGGAYDAGVTPARAYIQALDADGNPLCYFQNSDCDYLLDSSQIQFSGGGITGSAGLYAPPDAASAVRLVVEGTASDGSGTLGVSDPIDFDRVKPYIVHDELISTTQVKVYFNEPVSSPTGNQRAFTDWTVDGNPVTAVSGPDFGDYRILTLASASDEDATPQVNYIPEHPVSDPYQDQAANTLAGGPEAGRFQLAADRAAPQPPTVATVGGKAVPTTGAAKGTVSGTQTSPTVTLSGIKQGHYGVLFLESTVPGAFQLHYDTFLGESLQPADATGTVTVQSNPLPGDGTYTLYGVARDQALCDPNPDPSGSVGTPRCPNYSDGSAVTYTLDTVKPQLLNAATTGSQVTVDLSENVTGTDDKGQWAIQNGNGAAVTGVSGTGSHRVLDVSPALPGPGATLVWTPPASGAYHDDAGNQLDQFSATIIDGVLPSISVSDPASNVYVTSSSHQIAGSTKPNATVKAYRDTDGDGSPDGSAVATTSSGTGGFTISVPLNANDTNDFVLQATDAVGAGPFAKVPSIVQDVVQPQLSLQAPTTGQWVAGGSQFTIKWAATDKNFGPGPIAVTFCCEANGQSDTLAQGDPNDGSLTWTVPTLNTDQALITITATDQVGNATTQTSGLFGIDSTPPFFAARTLDAHHVVLTFSEPVSGSAANADWSIATFPAQAVDNGGANPMSTITLATTQALGADETPTITYRPVPSVSTPLTDRAGNQIPSSLRSVTATDGIAPGAPALAKIGSRDASSGSVPGNTCQPDVSVSNITNGELATVYLESGDAAGVSSNDRVVGKATAGATGATVHTDLRDPADGLCHDGSYLLYVTATDPSGNTSPAAGPATYVVDVTAPAVIAAATTDPTHVTVLFTEAISGTDNALEWHVSPGGPVTGISGSGDTRVLDVVGAQPGATLSWSPTPAVGGYSDAAGNSLAAFSTPVLGDLPPIAKVLSPDASVYTNAPTFDVSGTSTGDTVELYADPDNDGKPASGATPVATAAVNSGSYTVTAPLTADSNNDFVIRAVNTAKSLQGPYANVPTIVQDATPPAVTLVAPVGGEVLAGGSRLQITWKASDAHLKSGPITLQYAPDGSTFSDVVTNRRNNGAIDWTVPADNTDSAVIRVLADDVAGNQGAATSGHFVVDSVSPTFKAKTVDPSHVAITFSEPVQGTVAADEWNVGGWGPQDATPTGASGSFITGITLAMPAGLGTIRGNDTPTIAYAPHAATGRSVLSDAAGNQVRLADRTVTASDGIAPGKPQMTQYVHLTGATKLTLAGTASPEQGDKVVVTRTAPTQATFSAPLQDSGAFSVDVQLVPDASNDFEAKVVDPSGNASPPAALATIVQDSTKPALRFVKAHAHGRRVRVRWADVELHKSYVQLSYRLVGHRGWHLVIGKTLDDGRVTWWASRKIAGRLVRVRIVAFDRLGHHSQKGSKPLRLGG